MIFFVNGTSGFVTMKDFKFLADANLESFSEIKPEVPYTKNPISELIYKQMIVFLQDECFFHNRKTEFSCFGITFFCH